MKISAIRLKEVGRFNAPVAIEGLSGGLDVLVGPNEFGKSTIINAVRTVLFEQYRSKHRKLEALRPYSGGAPTIEVDFEARGQSWRIRKQYLAAPAAELRDLRSNTVMRGADAEAQLAELIGGNGPFGLLYVEQGTSLAPVAAKTDGGPALLTAIEREMASLADGNAARFVAEQVREQLATLVTARHGRPTGVYKSALDELKRLDDERGRARDRLTLARQRLDELERVRSRLAELADPAVAEEREQAAQAARRALDEGREARRKADAAEAAVAAASQHCKAIERLLRSLEKQIDDLARLEKDLGVAEQRLAELGEDAAAAKAAADNARSAYAELRAGLAQLEKARRAGELAGRLRQGEAQLATARAAEAACAAAAAELKAIGVDEALVAAVRQEAAALSAIEARLTAAAPTVSVAYFAGAAGRLVADGRALDDGEVLHPTRPLTLTIAGIGTVTIAPGQSSDVAADEAAATGHRRRLAALLARAGAGDLGEAEHLLATRRDVEARLQQATIELRSAAPQGVDVLARACAQLRSQLDALGEVDDADAEALEQRSHELADALRDAEGRVSELSGAERATGEALLALQTLASANTEQAAKLSAELGTPEVRARLVDERRSDFAAARKALEAAVVDGEVWRERAPSVERYKELEQVAAVTASALAEAVRTSGELRETAQRLEGALESDRDADVEALVSELEDQHAGLAARCRDMADEAAALQLLATEIDAAEARSHDRFVVPVLQRLTPYLHQVMPGATLRLDADLAPDGLERVAGREDFSRLSGGTREQISLLVRLALARLLADAGEPAPFILDDALVFADDDRIGGMFAALREAAKRHQVFVLTCHDRTFAALGGNRVALARWEGARAAA
jgi:uncharacterized protein YhaN